MTKETPARPSSNGHKPQRRQFVRFAFYKIDPQWRRLDPAQRAADVDAFVAAVNSFRGRMLLHSYSLVGLRGDADLLLWQITEDLSVLREFASTVNQTSLGAYLQAPYAFLSMTRRSIYEIPDEKDDSSERLTLTPGPSKYLFVYPFVKTRPWYALPKDERQSMMEEHIHVGRKYPNVKINTTYSYGLDDQEFVVAFETDDAASFLDLVAELRETQASLYTLRDTPMFTCEAQGLPETLRSLAVFPDTRAIPATPTMNGAQNHSDTPEWEQVAMLDDLPVGTSKLVYAGGESVALWNVDGRVFAVNNRCTHARGSLCDGMLEGTTVVCPSHGGRFDLATGTAIGAPAKIPVSTYVVRITSKGAIEVSTQANGPESKPAVDTNDTPAVLPGTEDLDVIDRKLLNLLQWQFPMVEKPFLALAESINEELAKEDHVNIIVPVTEEAIMARVERLRERTVIRQLSAIFDTRKLGYKSSLVAMKVAPERLDEAAAIINEHPGVSHNYQRDNYFNLWFTLAVPPEEDLDEVLAALSERADVEVTRKLPNLKMYKIAVKLDMEKDERDITRKDEAPKYAKDPRKLTSRDRELVRAVQDDLPTRSDFFAEAAAQAGVTVPELFAWMNEMEQLGYMRRFAAILRHQEAGFTANGMITWKVPEDRVDEVGFGAAAYPQVSHCYRRPIYPDWQYNVFSMVHARSREACEEIAQRMSVDLGVEEYIILYSTHEYKKTRVEYFSRDWDRWNLKDGAGDAWTDLDQRIAAGEFKTGPTSWRERVALRQG